jgi:predicted transposase/invertase (TIGR01784 family)
VINNEVPVESAEERQLRIDINVIFNDGERSAIEMALTERPDEIARSEYTLSKIFMSQKSKSEKDYNKLKRAYQITLMDKGKWFEDDEMIHEFEYYDKKRNISLGGKTKIITMEMSKLTKTRKSIDEMDAKERWGAFLKWVNDKSKQKEVAQIANLEGGISMAVKALSTVSADEIMKWRAYLAEKRKKDYLSEMAMCEKRGREEGRELGRKEGEAKKAIETARNLLKYNVDLDIISKSSGLSIEQINALRQ